MSMTSVLGMMAPDWLKKSHSSDYGFDRILITVYEGRKRTFRFYRNEISERIWDDVCPIKINSPNHTMNRDRYRYIKAFIDEFGDTVQFEMHDAYVLYRCNLTRADLTDRHTYFPGYCFLVGRNGIHDVKINFE